MIDYREMIEGRFYKKQRRNPAFSMRSYAKILGINHGALSQILSGKRIPSYQMALKIAHGLELNQEDEEDFLYAVALEHFERKPIRMNPTLRQIVLKKGFNYKRSQQKIEQEQFKIISDWYHYAIFMMFQKDDFRFDLPQMAKSLDLSESEVERAINRLVSLNILFRAGNSFECNSLYLDTANKHKTSIAHKNRQKQILEKSIQAIDGQDIKRRNHSAMTLALDPEQIPEIKKRIDLFMNELCEFIDKGKKKEIFELQTSLFSLER